MFRGLAASGLYTAALTMRLLVESEFKPAGGIQSAGEVAQAIVQCIKKPKLEVYPTRLRRVLVWTNSLSPGLVDKIMMRYLRDRLDAAKAK